LAADLKRSSYTIYAVTLREHPEIVKIGRTTNWRSRRNAYDTWNFASGDGVLGGVLYTITDEYVDLSAVEKACLSGMSMICSIHRGSEWFHGTLDDAKKVIDDILCAGGITFLQSEIRSKNG
jgi:T5orf172 domain